MPTLAIPFGMPVTMVTNQVYALPAAKATVFSDATTPSLQSSTTLGFVANAAVVFTGGLATVAGGFIRATTGTPTIVLKRD